MLNIVLIIGILCLIIQSVFWLACTALLTVNKRSSTEKSIVHPAVSIVICARNEAENLQRNIPAFMGQKNILLEVIVVDDASTDETPQILDRLVQEFSALKIIRMSEKTGAGKKSALMQGILHAKYDTVLLSDADCFPASENWAEIMTAEIGSVHVIVAGYSPFLEDRNSLNTYARYENAMTALQYIGLGRLGLPYMGVGRNIAYQKSALAEIGYFKSHSDLIAGDDDLTVQALLVKRGPKSMTFVTNEEAFVWTNAPKNRNEYFRQKLRHYSVSGHYPFVIGAILSLIHISWLLFYIGLIVLLLFGSVCYFAFLLVAYVMIRLIGWQKIEKGLGQRFTLKQKLVLDIIYPVLTLILTIFGLLKKNRNWT